MQFKYFNYITNIDFVLIFIFLFLSITKHKGNEHKNLSFKDKIILMLPWTNHKRLSKYTASMNKMFLFDRLTVILIIFGILYNALVTLLLRLGVIHPF